jgi:hypothetical protein
VSKERSALARGEKLEAGSDDSPEIFDGSRRCFSQERLEFGKNLLDRVEVRTIGWKIEEGRAASLDCFANSSDFMNAHVAASVDEWKANRMHAAHREKQRAPGRNPELLNQPLVGIVDLQIERGTERAWRTTSTR